MIITASSVAGNLATLVGPSSLEVEHLPDQVIVRASCAADMAGHDGQVDVQDLLFPLTGWGDCPTDDQCPDTNADGHVDVSDLLAMLAAWGPCD
ncbi:MAG: hypothetical protein ACYTGG_12785 [Planctomycetota bacterium]